jgi:hypothetical protein
MCRSVIDLLEDRLNAIDGINNAGKIPNRNPAGQIPV